MDLTKFQELADNTLGLQPPQYDGRWIQADVWQMYSLGDSPYRNSLPAFKQNQEALFDIIKEQTGASLVHSLFLVKANPNTVMIPLPKGSGMIRISGEKLWGIKWKPDISTSQKNALMKPYSPKYIRDFGEDLMFPIKSDWIFTGTDTTFITYDDALFFIFRVPW